MAKKKQTFFRSVPAKSQADARKEIQSATAIARGQVPAEQIAAVTDQLRTDLNALPSQQPVQPVTRPPEMPYIEPGTPEYSDAFIAARKAWEEDPDPLTRKIGPGLRKNVATGEIIHFPAMGDWQPDNPPELQNVGNASIGFTTEPVDQPALDKIAATDAVRQKLARLDGQTPDAWQWQAHIPGRIAGASDTSPQEGPDGTYGDWLRDRHDAISNDQALDGLVRPQFDTLAAGNPLAAANARNVGDTWRTVQALTPPGGTVQPSQGKPEQKPKGSDQNTVGLPFGKQYPDLGTMAQDWVGAAAGAVNELVGIKPAKGETAQAGQPMTADQALQYLTGGKNAPPPAQKGPLDVLYEVTGNVVRTGAANVVDAIGNIGPGVYAGVKDALDGIDAVADYIGTATGTNYNIFGEKVSPDQTGFGLPDLPDPATPAGVATRNVAQFLTGWVIGGKALQGLGWAAGAGGKVAQTARFMTQGAIADAGFFDGQSGKLGDLLVQVPALKNPVTEFLATDPNDSEAEGRFKNALNGIIATPLIPAFVGVVRAGRGAGRWAGILKSAQATADAPMGQAAAPKSLLGDAAPEAPLTLPAPDPAAAKLATASAEVQQRGMTAIGAGEAGGPQVFANFAAIKTPDDIQKIANDLAAAYEGTTDAARRGVVTFEQTKAAAGELNAFDTLMARKTGEAPNDAQVYAWKSLYEGSLRKLQEVAQQASQAPLNEAPAALLQVREMESVVLAVQKEFYGARAEAGRALNAFKISGDQALQSKQIEALLNQFGGIDANMDLARKIAAIGDPKKLADFVEQSTFAKTKDAWRQIYYANVLSGFKTHIRNFVGNNVMLGLNVAETGIASQLSRLMGDDAVVAGEALANWYGIKMAFGDALQAGGAAWRTGVTTGGYGLNKADAPIRNAISAETWGMAQTGPLSRAVDALGAITMVPGRAMMTSDEFFKTVGASATGYQLAFRQAMDRVRKGQLQPDQVADYVTSVVQNFPQSLDNATRAAVAEKAAYLTFTDTPGKWTSALLKWRGLGDRPDASLGEKMWSMAATTVIPFVNTPSKIMLATFERTPLAPLTARYRDAIAKGGADAYQANARMALGSMTMATWVDLAMNGTVTGQGPSPNSPEYSSLYATGWRPYSIKVGDHYVSYQSVAPLSTVLGWAASIGEMMSNTETSDPTAQENIERAVSASVFALSDLVLSQSYLSGASDLMDAINSGEATTVENYVKRLGAGLVVPNAVRDARNAVDPVQRYTTNMLEEMRNRIPGLSADLPPRRDAFGFVKSYQSGFGTAYDALSPFYASQIKDLPIASAMLKDGWAVSVPAMAFSIDGQRVDVSQQPVIYSRFLELRGQVKPSALTGKITPDYGATDRYASGEAAQIWADRLTDRYGDRNMVETLNGIVSESPPYDLRDVAETYHSFTDADDRRKFMQKIIGDYQDAAKAALFSEYPELPARAAQLKAAGDVAAP